MSLHPFSIEERELSRVMQALDFMAFLESGMIEQLKYEGFSDAEAEYGADWNEQAASYLEFMSFSREGIIEQLEYEGFTHEQAVYGVTAVGY